MLPCRVVALDVFFCLELVSWLNINYQCLFFSKLGEGFSATEPNNNCMWQREGNERRDDGDPTQEDEDLIFIFNPRAEDGIGI